MSIGYIKQTAASVPTPPTGEMNTFIDSADDKLKRKDSTGTVSTVESAGATPPASSITFTPSGDIIATDVQAAIEELDAEKAPITHVGAGGPSEHPIATGVVAGFLSPSDFTKLAGVDIGATANDTDANLRARASHTGTQTAATISDFTAAAKAAAVQDAIANGITDIAPSQNAVFDGLALKSDTSHTHVVANITDFATGISGKANKSGDTFTGEVVVEGDMNGTGTVNLVTQGSDPSTPASGVRMFSDVNEMLSFKGQSGFKAVINDQNLTADRQFDLPDNDGALMSDPMTAAGSMIRRNASNQNVDLPIGAEDEILRVVSGLPEWVEENLSQDIGGGGDGNLTLSGAFTAPDILYYNELTIDAGTVFNPDAYIVYAKKLDLTNAPAGAIVRSGNNGTTSANNSGGAGGAGFTARVLATNGAGGTGSNGQTNNGAQGAAGTAIAIGNGGNGGASGTSGAGGTGIAANGISGGAVTTNIHFGRFEYQFLRGAAPASGGAGGRGGNAGGGDGANSSRGAGGGGAGGAVLVLIIGELVTGPSTPAGVIQAKGGNGGTQTSAPTAGNCGGSGGGGGGGGGYIYLAYVKKTGTAVVDLLDASGGNGGNGSVALGTGVGGNGGAGGNGGRIQLFNVTEGMGTLLVGSAGALGSVGVGLAGGTGGNGGSCKQTL